MPPKTSSGLSSVLQPYPPLVRLLKLWEERAGDRAMPARHDLDTLTLRDWLGYMHLVDVTDEGQYHYRIFGTSIGRLFGRDLQSRPIKDLPEPERSEAIQDYGSVVSSRQPHFIERQRNVVDKIDILPRPRLVGKLCLPLSDDGANVSQILAAIYPRPE